MSATAQERIEETTDRVRNEVEQRRAQLQQGIQKADNQFRAICREHPVAVVVGAAAAGYVIGRILSRR